MSRKEIDEVSGTETTGHEWDGIKELDTPMPRWWLGLFWICIIWAVGYWIVYPAWPGITSYTHGIWDHSQRDEVTAEDLQKEKEIYKDQARASGKPENIVEKIAEGKLESFYKETCLYDQAFVKDPNLSVEQLITNLVGKIGENIRVRRFVRFVTGEGLEKRSTDLKGEVEGMLGGQ